MPKTTQKKFEQVEVSSDEQWNSWLEKSDQMLLVVDIHKQWCGPCTIMEPTYAKVGMNIDEFKKRCVILLVNDKAEIPMLQEFTSVETCKPFFIMIKHKSIIFKLSGANAAALEEAIHESVPELEEEM